MNDQTIPLKSAPRSSASAETSGVTCLICGQETMRDWLLMPIDPKKESSCTHGRVHRCVTCGFGAVLPRPREEEVGAFYELEHYYTHGSSHMAEGGRVTFVDRLREHLAWRLDRGQPFTPARAAELLGGTSGEVCDLGCGGGGFAARMKEYGFRVVGVEVDTAAAVHTTGSGVELHVGTAERLPEALGDRRFDLVVMSHVLEHCLDPVRALENAAGLVRPGGYFVCEVPNCGCAGFAWSGAAWEPLDVPRHLNFFVPDNLRLLCRRAGLSFHSLFFYNYLRQFTNSWIRTEQRIGDAIARSGVRAEPRPVRNSKVRAWALLARTALARTASRYDSVGLIARRPA